MIVQLAIGALGSCAIRTFESGPRRFRCCRVIIVAMTVMAFVKGHIVWHRSTAHGSSFVTSATELMAAVGIGWGFSWVAWASDYSQGRMHRVLIELCANRLGPLVLVVPPAHDPEP